MKINTITLRNALDLMGSEATDDEARAMLTLLRSGAWTDTDEIDNETWRGLIDRAAIEAREQVDNLARIISIERGETFDTVNLEFTGPDDHSIWDFDIARLGEVSGHGGNLVSGWVVLGGRCLLSVGDSIPLAPVEEAAP